MRLQDVENRVYILLSKAKLCPSIYGMLYSILYILRIALEYIKYFCIFCLTFVMSKFKILFWRGSGNKCNKKLGNYMLINICIEKCCYCFFFRICFGFIVALLIDLK